MMGRIALVCMFVLGSACVSVLGLEPLSAGSSLEQILDALDARGRDLVDFSADVSLSQSDVLGSGVSTLSGKVFFQARADADARMRVAFDTRAVGKKVDKEARLEYLLDKGWLIEQDFKHKVQVDRQVLKPGQKINLLKLGEGPFPLPIGQPRGEVLKMFDVKKLEAAKEDPAETVHIQLSPKPRSQFERKFKSIDVWVDLKTSFPRRIETLDRNQTEVRTTDLSNVQVNKGLDAGRFVLEKAPETWTHRTEEMSE